MIRATSRGRARAFPFCVAVILALSGLASPRAHANLVINSGFETDDTTAGPVSPPTAWTATGNAGADSSLPNSGANDGFLGNGSLSESINTVAGQIYTISFYTAPDVTAFIDPDASFAASFGGTNLLPGGSVLGDFSSPSQYLQFFSSLKAATSASILSFTGLSTFGGTFYLDDVSVTPASVSAVPLPPSSALMIIALATMTIVKGRRDRKS